MKRFVPVVFALLLPAALFAQGKKADETGLLQGFGLSDAQVTQVRTIELSTRDAIRADITHIRLVQAQIAEALLPSAAGPDAKAIDVLIERKGRFRTDIDKQIMSARLQLLKIMGDDNFAKYERFVRDELRHRVKDGRPMGFRGPGFMQEKLGTQESF
ncbi:MAG TPA: hypothetical protein VMV90_14730 [Rectinemataceae bacterium]|nr:hypothetical protein [Rectinemataceae bacterium]